MAARPEPSPSPSPMTPVSRKPACAIEEYASIRLRSVWVSPRTAPTIIEAMATP